MTKLLDKFLRYVKIETTSLDKNSCQPSSEKEWDLINLLKDELVNLGVKNVEVSKYGYIYAKIPSNINRKVPSICFIAHVDTADDVSGKNVKPLIHENYNGKDIKLNENLTLTVDENPALKNLIGQTIITSSGDTLLGADDKSGVAIIMSMVQYFMENPNIEHGDICIAFTPDEEIGRGTENFDVKNFGADYGYTIDGGSLGEIEYQNFNAASMVAEFFGKTIHPGDAKNRMINSINIFNEFHNNLPSLMRPEHTENFEGFFHLHSLQGSVDYTKAEYLIREHNKELFNDKKNLCKVIGDNINKKFNSNVCKITIKDSYYNMEEIIKQNFHLVTNAKKAMELANVEPIIKPIRGGTDGANLSFMNLPCANLCTGGYNFHSNLEFVPLESMEKILEIVINIIKIYSEIK